MGYDSTFSGELRPNRPIPKELAKRIDDACLDVRVTGEHEADYYEPGTVVPACVVMRGYNIVEDIVKVQRLLSKHGIKLSGDIQRSGEEGGDFDLVEVRQGRVYYRPGRIVYGKREERGVESVMRYAVRVLETVKTSKGERRRIVGWASTVSLIRGDVEVFPDYDNGEACVERPKNNALSVKSLDAAREIVRRLKGVGKNSKRKCEIVSWEDEI